MILQLCVFYHAGRRRERTGDEETGAVWFPGQRGDLHKPAGGPATGETHTPHNTHTVQKHYLERK